MPSRVKSSQFCTTVCLWNNIVRLYDCETISYDSQTVKQNMAHTSDSQTVKQNSQQKNEGKRNQFLTVVISEYLRNIKEMSTFFRLYDCERTIRLPKKRRKTHSTSLSWMYNIVCFGEQRFQLKPNLDYANSVEGIRRTYAIVKIIGMFENLEEISHFSKSANKSRKHVTGKYGIRNSDFNLRTQLRLRKLCWQLIKFQFGHSGNCLKTFNNVRFWAHQWK